MDIATIAVVAPVLVALITAVVGPYILNRRKNQIDQNNMSLQGEIAFRKDLLERTAVLEQRLEDSARRFNDALDTVREVKSRYEICRDRLSRYEKTEEAHERRREEDSYKIDTLEGRSDSP